MAYLQWLQEDIRACCPLCGEEGPKGAVLSTDHVLSGHPRITLLRCPACGAAFLQDLTPPDYEISLAQQLDYYVEQGAGIDCIVAPLLRLPSESVRRCLDVGCSFGFALDFSRYAFGWEVLGVDPSPLAGAGAAALDLPIRQCYFSAGLDLGPEPFDLILCSEILEHLAEPLALLVAMRERLSPEGLLVLSTPNLAIVRRETDEGTLGRALSPGFHLMLYSRGALSLLLTKAGFSEVRIEESPETLRAFAACSPSALARMRPADPGDRNLLRAYFGARAADAPPDSALACGFAWRHFKECVNAGLDEEAAASRAVLARIYQKRFGIDLMNPAEITARLPSRPLPFNLTGALFLSGILELNSLGDPERAADDFAAAIAAGDTLLDEQRPTGLCDGETETFTELGRKHLPMARAQTFVRLVHAGAYAEAERLAPQVSQQVEESGLDALYCLAMLALQAGRPGEAADLFGRVARLVRSERPERADLFWPARYHEGLGLSWAGQAETARVVMAEVAAAASGGASGGVSGGIGAGLPPVPADLAEAARALVGEDAPAPRPGRLLIAERFVAPCVRLSTVLLPLDVIAREPLVRLRVVLFAADRPDAPRVATLAHPRLSPEEALRLVFAPFDAPAGATFFLGVFDLSEDPADAADLLAVRAAAGDRPPIGLDCQGEEDSRREGDSRKTEGLLLDESGIAVYRDTSAVHPKIRTAYWLDAFWCDPHGIYLRGWIHAYEHRVRGLRVESAGRSARTETFSDRPDLLNHYPEHEHVRHGGFAVYLACPPGHPVSLTVETDGGATTFPLPLPEGPLPVWPKLPDGGEAGVSPMLRHFAELINSSAGPGGLLLQIGARTPHGTDVIPPRRLLQGRVIGLDIHPGRYVDVVGDAHGMSRFLRDGSVDAVLSASVLEHLQAPWVLAAEINRVLKPGGLIYHQAPGAWPAHAQPNDFWRFSAEGLRVLFGPETGYEVLEACDSGPAAIIPGPDWREDYLDMPTVPAYGVAEILARKVADVEPGAVAWPLGSGASETRSRQYPVSGLRPASHRGSS